MTSHLTTHVLDATSGSPGSGITITLIAPDGIQVAEGTTDADGRLALGPEELAPGDYSLVFATRDYFDAREVASFYPSVTVAFTIADGAHRHYHVPLLLSPFAYSTYRGS